MPQGWGEGPTNRFAPSRPRRTRTRTQPEGRYSHSNPTGPARSHITHPHRLEYEYEYEYPPRRPTAKEPTFPPALSPTPAASHPIAPGWPRNEAHPGSTSQNDPRTPKAVRRISSASGSLSKSGSNNAATRCRYRFRPRHRCHGTRATRRADQLQRLTDALTAPSRNAPVLPTRCFGPSSHAASEPASILFILPILSAAGHGDETPHPNPVDSLCSQSRHKFIKWRFCF